MATDTVAILRVTPPDELPSELADETDKAPASAPVTATVLPSGGVRRRVLVVHDQLEWRLKFAALLGKADPAFAADTLSSANYAGLSLGKLRDYTAIFFILDFAASETAADPLLVVARLRDQAPRVKAFVVARGGDEISAVRAIHMGAADYWPVHFVKIAVLKKALSPLVEAAPRPRAAPKTERAKKGLTVPGYKLIKPIAQTGSTTVYLAKNDESDTPLALKVQMVEEMTNEVKQRFLRECRLLSSLNHKSIADVLDHGATESCLYLAVEYFPCGSLRDRLRNPVDESDAHAYAKQIGEVLQVIHGVGIVHRDLKPANLMLTDDNRLVLIDFGLARFAAPRTIITQANSRVGTPYYVSPEQMSGELADARSDLYSLGIILFEMLAGTLPYMGKTLDDIVRSHQSASVPRLPEQNAHYQPVIDRLLAKQRADRYESAAEFLLALEQAHGAGTASS